MTEESKWCNLVIKVILILVNFIIWILGGALLAIGIIAQLQGEDYGDVSSSVLQAPAIACIALGSILFILGVLGIVGALVEFYYLLLIYSLLLILILLAEIGIAAFVFVRSDETEDIVREQLEELIVQYRSDPDLQNLIDTIQSDLLECCGINMPDDWELNPYFNCSSVSLQKCSVPFSCCLPVENSTVINTQCGDGALEQSKHATRKEVIYTNGCYGEFEELIQDLLPVLGGIVIGIVLTEIVSIILALGLALDIRKENEEAKKWKIAHPNKADNSYKLK